MSKINTKSDTFNVGSSFNVSQKHFFFKAMFHDVYSVYEIKKHYLWCLESVQKRLKNLAFALSTEPSPESVKHHLQRASQDDETLAEKVAVAFAFSAAVLLVCFSAFVVF